MDNVTGMNDERRNLGASMTGNRRQAQLRVFRRKSVASMMSNWRLSRTDLGI